MRTIVLISILLFLTAVTSVSAKQGEPTVNGISVYDSKEKLVATLGHPLKITKGEGGCTTADTYYYAANGEPMFSFTIDHLTEQVHAIVGDSVNIPGIGRFEPGCAKRDVEKALGRGPDEGIYIVGRTLLNFRFDQNENLVQVWARTASD